MDKFLINIINLSDNKTIILLCGLFIFGDFITGYIKAFKYKRINSTISRDGFIKKLGWIIAIMVGLAINFLCKINIFFYITAIICISTESMSLYENLAQIGINLPFKKYFEKLQDYKKN